MDYGDNYDFSDWFGDDYGSGYTPSEGSSVDSGAAGGGTFGDWNQGNYDYTYGNNTDYGNDFFNNINNQVMPDYGNTNYFGGIDTTGLQTGTGATWNAPNAGSIQNTLSSLFQGGMNNPLIGKGLSALMEGYQNKQKQAAMNKIAAGADPWGSQRPFYQQQARQAVTDPYSSPIVKAQIEQLQRAQSIKDAQAGRRSNMLTSSPAVMAQMAQIAQQYQNQMAQQGGAGIAPSAAGMQAATSGATAGINGYISPLLTALGWNNQSNTNNSVLANLTKDQKTALAKQWATE